MRMNFRRPQFCPYQEISPLFSPFATVSHFISFLLQIRMAHDKVPDHGLKSLCMGVIVPDPEAE